MNHQLIMLLALSMVGSCATMLRGQEIEVQMATEEPPHYVGVSAVVQLTVEGLEADPDPDCTVKIESDDVRARLSGISPQIVQQMFRSGGQLRRIQQVTHTIQFSVTANKAGEYEIGPFLITQAGKEKEVGAITMSFQEVPLADDMKIKLKLPETAYPDQRVPVGIEWWFAGDTESVNSLNINAPLFDEFRFAADAPARRGTSRIPIQTSEGSIALSATAREETVDGQTFTVVAAERTLIPDRPGKFELEPIRVTIEAVTKWQRQRSSFGGSLLDEAFGNRRRPAKVEMFRATGEPLTFTVKPFPKKNRPESFAGAVGSGFSLEVAADRTVVRAGDPIRLTINLRGDGNIEGAKLPSLSADGGLNAEKFRLPEDEVAGVFEKGAKQFVVSVRVLDESINEIPAIAYSWFDAEQELYQTARSKPIALRVTPARVVGANSVVSSQPQRMIDPDPSNNQPPSTPSNSANAYSLSGADLAIETDAGKLLATSTNLLSRPSFQLTGYALGSACLLLSLIDRRRRQEDPAQREIAMTIRTLKQRISAAANLSPRDAATEIAAALQAAHAKYPDADGSAIRRVVADCEAIAYQPDQTKSVSQELVKQAIVEIDNLARENSA